MAMPLHRQRDSFTSTPPYPSSTCCAYQYLRYATGTREERTRRVGTRWTKDKGGWR
jgi:hypothetical protein